MWRSERSLVWNFLFTSYEAMNKLTVQARGFYKLVGVIQTLHRSQTEELVISGYTELRQGSTSDIWRFLDMPSALPLPSLEMLLSLPDLPPLLLNLNAVTHFYGRRQLAAPCRKSSCQPGGVSPLKPHSPSFYEITYPRVPWHEDTQGIAAFPLSLYFALFRDYRYVWWYRFQPLIE